MLKPFEWGCRKWGKNELEERDDEASQRVETLHREATWRDAICQTRRVRCTRRQDAWTAGDTERERDMDKSCDMWQISIGCLNFYLLNNLNSIISLQIIFNFFFFTKIHDFFLSINRDFDRLIWTQKKKPSCITILILLLAFY